MLRYFRILIPLLLLFSGYATAQHFPVQRLTVEEGLGHSIVYRTAQTSDGYIWISTDNGLTRYNGASFINFTTADGLPSNFIFDVKEYAGELYVCTLGGGIMIYKQGRFRPAFDSSYHAPLHPVEIRITDQYFTIVDRFKHLYILKDKRFVRITYRDLHLDHGNQLDFLNVEIFGNEAYISTTEGLFLLKHGQFSEIPVKQPLGESVCRIARYGEHNLLVVVNAHLLHYNLKTGESTTLLRGEYFSRYSRILVDSDSNIWISTVDGKLFFLTRQRDSYHSVRVFDNIVLNDIFEDREKNIWISTYGEGAWIIQSVHIRNHPIKGYIVSDLSTDPNTNDLLVSTTNAGLRVFRKQPNNSLHEITSNRLGQLFRKEVFVGPAIATDDNTLVISTAVTLKKINSNKYDSLQVRDPIVSLYYQKKTNRIWIGCRFSLAFTDPSLSGYTLVPEMNNRVVRSIAELPDGRIVAGTDAGLMIQEGEQFVPVPAETLLQNADVNSVFYDNFSNTIWAATNTGLCRVVEGRLMLIRNQLTQSRCNSITQDENGVLYIGSVKGLIIHNGTSFEMLSTKEGLAQSNVVRVNYQRDNKQLALLSPNSISTVDTESIPEFVRFTIPDILIESIRTPEDTVMYQGHPMRFTSNVRHLDIRVSVPQIRNRDKVRYRYRINDKEWTLFTGNEITLHGLPAGEVKVSIEAYKVNDHSEAKTATLTFFIPPPFYSRWWFIAILFIVFSSSLAFFVLTYSRKKNEKLMRENERLAVEHKALRNLLNPHFLFNAINSIHAFILQNDQRQTLGYLSKFSQLVRLNLELLSSDHTTLEKEIKNIGLYLEFEKLRFAEKLTYHIDIDEALILSDIIIPPFIIQPFAENAIWHGLLPRQEGGQLTISVREDAKTIFIIIDDNGIGINQSLLQRKPEIEKKTSMGINIIRDRVELLRRIDTSYQLSIVDKSDLGNTKETGTRVTITVPRIKPA